MRDLGLREAEDPDIFVRARSAQVVVFTKDEDFVNLVRRLGTPPKVLWLTCGNMSNVRLKALLAQTLREAIALLEQGEAIVEISRGTTRRRRRARG